jgi:hypothetical protein
MAEGGRLAELPAGWREAAGSAMVSVWEIAARPPSGAAQLPQNLLVSGFSVAQLGQRVIGLSLAGGPVGYAGATV